MNQTQIEACIKAHGGTIKPAINWTWAIFSDDTKGRACFAIMEPHIDHRGYYAADPSNSNSNLHLGGFRYR